MSELVEKVMEAIEDEIVNSKVTVSGKGLSRAAIKAVAEWLKDDLGTEFCATGERLHIKLLAQLEDKP
jgi:hypothetical protein